MQTTINRYAHAFADESTQFHDITALMLSVINNHSWCIPYLAPYEIGMADKNGMTSLMHAANTDHVEYISHLIQEIGRKCNDGYTALMYAAMRGSHKFIHDIAPYEAGDTSKEDRMALARNEIFLRNA